MSSESSYFIYAISDATGESAMNLAFAAMRQFKVENVHIIRRAKVTDHPKIRQLVHEVKKKNGIIVHTLVSPELRSVLHEQAEQEGVVAVDVMGPLLNVLTTYFHSTPSSEPGLKYRLTKDYFRRQEAIEYTVKHDDGIGYESLESADLVLLGISRTSKTPLSVYLAYRGYKVANVPIVQGMPIPASLATLDRKKMVGLTITPQKLVQLRESRLLKLGRPLSEEYASLEQVKKELEYCNAVFQNLGGIPLIDVTDKAIEEIASEVLAVLGK